MQNECRPGDDVWVPRAVEFIQTNSNADLRAAAIDALADTLIAR
jgi:hypothetical protein